MVTYKHEMGNSFQETHQQYLMCIDLFVGRKTSAVVITTYGIFMPTDYYYIRLTAFFQDNLGKPASKRQTILDFTGSRDDGVAVASAGLCANHLHLAPDR